MLTNKRQPTKTQLWSADASVQKFIQDRQRLGWGWRNICHAYKVHHGATLGRDRIWNVMMEQPELSRMPREPRET